MKVSRGVQDRTARNLYLHKNFMAEGRTSKEAYDLLFSLSEYKRNKSFEFHRMVDKAKKAKNFGELA